MREGDLIMKKSVKMTAFFMVVLLILTAITVASFGALGARGPRATPTLTNGMVTPSTGNTNTQFEFKVTYTDSSNHSTAGRIWVILDGSAKTLSSVSGTPQTGELHNYKTKLSAGTHYYYFYVNNSQFESARFPATGNISLLVNSSVGSPPTLTGPSVSPSTGDSNTNFTFQITYTDVDGDLPSNINVVIDSSYNKMNFVSGTSTTGMIYTYQTKLSVGNHTYFFWVLNAALEAARNPGSGSYMLNVYAPPPLPMLFEGGVDPATGNTSTMFTFSVKYKDPGNNWDCNVSVRINGQQFLMSTLDSDLISGVTFTYSTKLAADDYTFFFLSENSESEVATDPIAGVYQLIVDPAPGNNPQLYNPLVSPMRPIADQTINFTIQYKDLDNDAPEYVDLYINRVELSTPFNKHSMKIVSSAYTTGVTCYITLELSEGNYTYYFATKSVNKTVNDHYESNFFFVLVEPDSSTPYLLGGTVTPTNGIANYTTFKYDVIYQDGKFGPALVSYVEIDGNLHAMVESSGDSGSLGVYYTYSTKLPAGTHTYRFIFSDGKVNISLPVSGVNEGPTVTTSTSNRPPTVTLSVSPQAGDLTTTFYFNASATDPDGDLLIYSWVFSDNAPVSGSEFVSRKFTTYGNHSATVTVADPYGLTASDNAVVSVREFNNPPVIRTNLKDTNYVTKDSSMYISGLDSYDLDNDPITYLWELTHSNSDYTKIYTVGGFNHRFELVGKYSLSLEISDGIDKSTDTFNIECTDSGDGTEPVARATVLVRGMTVSLSAEESYDLDGYITSYTWSIYSAKYYQKTCNHFFSTIGYKTATLTVEDNDGLTAKTVVGFFIGRPGEGNYTYDYDKTKVGGHVEVDEDEITVINAEDDFTISVIESKKNYLKFQVESDSESGRLMIMDVKTEFDLDALDEIEVRINNEKATKADLDTVLQTSGDKPLYFIVGYKDHYQLFVYIPDVTNSVVEVKLKETDDGPDRFFGANMNILFIITVIVIAAILLLLIGFIKIKRKEENEYYSDFRVAENRALNGVYTYTHTQVETPKEASENWDEFL
jgi:hypothetical protein